MSVGNWLHIIAFGGLVAVSLPSQPHLAHAQEPRGEALPAPKQPVDGVGVPSEHGNSDAAQARDGEHPHTAEQNSNIELPAGTAGIDATDEMLRSLGAADRCDEECQHNKNDLNAQENMADAAWAMFAASVVGSLLTGVGVVLVYLNLREARTVSSEAKRSSDAAVQMAQAMVGIELPVIQPRWFGSNVGATDELVIGNAPYGMTIIDGPVSVKFIAISAIHFRNFGRTVAIPTQMKVGFNFGSFHPCRAITSLHPLTTAKSFDPSHKKMLFEPRCTWAFRSATKAWLAGVAEKFIFGSTAPSPTGIFWVACTRKGSAPVGRRDRKAPACTTSLATGTRQQATQADNKAASAARAHTARDLLTAVAQ